MTDTRDTKRQGQGRRGERPGTHIHRWMVSTGGRIVGRKQRVDEKVRDVPFSWFIIEGLATVFIVLVIWVFIMLIVSGVVPRVMMFTSTLLDVPADAVSDITVIAYWLAPCLVMLAFVVVLSLVIIRWMWSWRRRFSAWGRTRIREKRQAEASASEGDAMDDIVQVSDEVVVETTTPASKPAGRSKRRRRR